MINYTINTNKRNKRNYTGEWDDKRKEVKKYK